MSNDEYYDDYYPQTDPGIWAMQQFMMPGAGGYPESGYMPAPGMPSPYMPLGPMGMQPEMDPLLYQQVMSLLQPSLTSKGKLEPYDIDYQGKIRNAQQDVYGSFDDPIWTLLSGLGATTPEAFDDITERKPMELKAQAELAIKAQMGGIEGQIAEMVLTGMSPMAAASAVRAAIEHPDQVVGGMSQEEADNLRGQLPTTMIQKPGGFGQEEGPDWGALYKTANDIANPYIAEQAMLAQPGIEYDEEGRAYTTSKKPSALQEFLQKTGIPDPRDTYGADFFAKQNPGEAMTLLDRISASEGRLKDAKKAYTGFLTESANRKRNLDQDARQKERYAGEMQAYGERLAPTGAAAATGLREYMSNISAASGRGDAPNKDAMAGQRALLNQILEEGPRATGQMGGIPRQRGIDMMGNPIYTSDSDVDMLAASTGMGFQSGGPTGSPAQVERSLGRPTAPRLSTYSEPQQGENLIQGQMRGLTNMFRQAAGGSRRPGPENNPKPLTGTAKSRGKDIVRRREDLGRANMNLMLALVPQLALAKSGRTPISDVFQQRMQPFYASGATGQPGMPWQYPRPPGR